MGGGPRRAAIRLPVQRGQPAHAAAGGAGPRCAHGDQLPRRAAAALCGPERDMLGPDGAGEGAWRHVARDDRARRRRPHRAPGLVRGVAAGDGAQPQCQVLRGGPGQLRADRAGPGARRAAVDAAGRRTPVLRPAPAARGAGHAGLRPARQRTRGAGACPGLRHVRQPAGPRQGLRRHPPAAGARRGRDRRKERRRARHRARGRGRHAARGRRRRRAHAHRLHRPGRTSRRARPGARRPAAVAAVRRAGAHRAAQRADRQGRAALDRGAARRPGRRAAALSARQRRPRRHHGGRLPGLAVRTHGPGTRLGAVHRCGPGRAVRGPAALARCLGSAHRREPAAVHHAASHGSRRGAGGARPRRRPDDARPPAAPGRAPLAAACPGQGRPGAGARGAARRLRTDAHAGRRRAEPGAGGRRRGVRPGHRPGHRHAPGPLARGLRPLRRAAVPRRTAARAGARRAHGDQRHRA